MIKLSRTGITTLKRQYKSVLLKCLLINAGILLAAGSANAETVSLTGIAGTLNDGVTDYNITSGTATATVDLSGYVTKVEGKGLSTHDYDDAAAYAVSTIGDKVDKEAGKGLSSNDYTDADKTKLAGLSNYDDTALSGRVTTLEGTVNNTASGLATKASQTSVDALTTRVTTAEGKITTLEGTVNNTASGLATKASQTSVDALTARVTTAEGDITNLKNAVNDTTTGLATRASQADLTALANVVNDTATGLATKTTLNEVKENAASTTSGSLGAIITDKANSAIATSLGDGGAIKTAISTAVNTAETNAKAYADSLATNYDAAGSAATAETNAKAYAKDYTDGLVGTLGDTGVTGSTVAAQIKQLDTEKQDALTNANNGNGISITAAAGDAPAKIAVVAETGGGLKVGSNGIAVLLDSDSGLATDGSGLKVDTKGIKTSMIDDSAVTTDKIANDAVTLDKIADAAMTSTATSGSAALMTSGGVYTLTNIATDGNHIKEGTNVANNLTKLDTAIGSMADFASQNYAKSTTSVAANLTSLDGALKSTNDILGGAEEDTPAATSLLTNQIGTGTNTVVASLRTVADNAAGLHLDNTFDGDNTFKGTTTFNNSNGITIGNMDDTSHTDYTTGTISVAKVEDVGAVMNLGADVVTSTEFRATSALTVENASHKEVFVADASGLTIGNGTDDLFTVDAATGNVETAGTVKIDTVTLTGADDKLVSDKKVVSENGFEVNDTTSLADNLLTVGDSTLSNTALTIGKASAITGTEGSLDMGANAVSNVKGLTLTDGDATDPKTVALTVDTNGELSVSEIIDATKGLRFSSDATAMTSVVRDAVAAKAATGSDAVVVSATALQATRAAINEENAGVFGALYSIDDTEKTVSYDATALSNNMFKYADGAALAAGADLTASLGKFASSLNAITGGTIDDEGKVNNNYAAATSIAYNTLAADGAQTTTLAQAIGQVDKNIGAAIDASTIADRTTGKIASTATVNANIAALDTAIGSDADLTTGTATITARGANNGVKVANSVNANIATLNSAIGDLSNLHVAYTATGVTGNAMTFGGQNTTETVVDALNNIDATLGTIHGLKAKLAAAGNDNGNLASGTTVEQHLTSLDAAIGDRSQFATGRYTSTSESVADATMALDKGLSDLADDVRDFRKEFKSGMAQMAAMSALVPNARAHGNTQVSVGTGAYEGQTAAAVGAFHWVNDNLLLNAGVSYGNSNNVAYRAGLTWSW